ncbi:hypothetical protein HDU82_001824 [Entophlyctis luteolus]|nr:hypothetical protein HDU82_001824 [Entophlyctis luteolus]
MVHCASGEHPISKVAGLLRLEKNPDDFAAWESLIKLAEAESAVSPSNLRLVYDGFLAKFPLCFGYWKKYADSALRLEGTEKADEVFERGVTAIQNSIDLWNHYIQFKLDKSDDVDAIRAHIQCLITALILMKSMYLYMRQATRTGIVWIAQAANSSNSKIPAGVRIGKEIIDVLNGTSSVLQKRLQVHKTALLNRSNVVLTDRRLRKF